MELRAAAPIRLKEGAIYDMQVEYRDFRGAAAVSLWWESESVEKEIVPRRLLWSREEPIRGSPFRTEIVRQDVPSIAPSSSKDGTQPTSDSADAWGENGRWGRE